MAEPIRGAGQPSWPASPYQIELSYGARPIGGQSGTPTVSASGSVAGIVQGRIVQGTGADWFGPLDPQSPVAPEDVAGRRFDFPVGYNLVSSPRAYEAIGFAELRGFADAYDLLRLVIETRKDQMERQRWRIRPRDPQFKRKNVAIDADMSARIAALEAFFAKPDGITRWKTWASIGFAAVVVLGWIVEGAVKWTVGWALSHVQ
jgi:hypothetical protein